MVSFSWLVGASVDWSDDWSVCWSIGLAFGGLTNPSVKQLVSWVSQLVGWLFCWLVGRVVDHSACQLTTFSPCGKKLPPYFSYLLFSLWQPWKFWLFTEIQLYWLCRVKGAAANIWVKIISMGGMHFPINFLSVLMVTWNQNEPSESREKHPVDKYTRESIALALVFIATWLN